MEINKRDNLDVQPILVGVSSYDFENIDNSISQFLEFANTMKYSIELMKYYSIHRHKIIGETFKLIFSSIFKKS